MSLVGPLVLYTVVELTPSSWEVENDTRTTLVRRTANCRWSDFIFNLRGWFFNSQGSVYTKAIRPWLLRILEFSLVESVTDPCLKFTWGQLWIIICNILSGWEFYVKSHMISMDNVGWDCKNLFGTTLKDRHGGTKSWLFKSHGLTFLV